MRSRGSRDIFRRDLVEMSPVVVAPESVLLYAHLHQVSAKERTPVADLQRGTIGELGCCEQLVVADRSACSGEALHHGMLNLFQIKRPKRTLPA